MQPARSSVAVPASTEPRNRLILPPLPGTDRLHEPAVGPRRRRPPLRGRPYANRGGGRQGQKTVSSSLLRYPPTPGRDSLSARPSAVQHLAHLRRQLLRREWLLQERRLLR